MRTIKNAYEVVTVQTNGTLIRVIHKDFPDWETARLYADDICDDVRTTACSIYKGEILIMNVL